VSTPRDDLTFYDAYKYAEDRVLSYARSILEARGENNLERERGKLDFMLEAEYHREALCKMWGGEEGKIQVEKEGKIIKGPWKRA